MFVSIFYMPLQVILSASICRFPAFRHAYLTGIVTFTAVTLSVPTKGLRMFEFLLATINIAYHTSVPLLVMPSTRQSMVDMKKHYGELTQDDEMWEMSANIDHK